MDDVLQHGSLPVPAHLRSSGSGRSRYRYPHDFEGDDVDQQYLPDKLVGSRYYFPGGQGMEARIAERLDRLADGRRQPQRRKPPTQGKADADPMSAGAEGMRRRRQSMREMAEEQRGDAADSSPKDPPAES
jgi:hypothetical protein